MNAKRTSTVLLFCFVLTFFIGTQSVLADSSLHFLRRPYNQTERINAFFDHHYPDYSQYDTEITIFNGESSPTENPYWYRGHSGTDFNLMNNTEVLAAAYGRVIFVYNNWTYNDPTGCGNNLYIDHLNGYFTRYCHLRTATVSVNNYVNAGDLIGYSSNTEMEGYKYDHNYNDGYHLHFEVFRGPNYSFIYSTDPFGWTGRYPDPLVSWPAAEGQSQTSQCLWRSLRDDDLSCNDTWVFDAGAGFRTFYDTLHTNNWGDTLMEMDHMLPRITTPATH